MNRGGEVWEKYEGGERELFAADIILRLEELEGQRNAAIETLRRIDDIAAKGTGNPWVSLDAIAIITSEAIQLTPDHPATK